MITRDASIKRFSEKRFGEKRLTEDHWAGEVYIRFEVSRCARLMSEQMDDLLRMALSPPNIVQPFANVDPASSSGELVSAPPTYCKRVVAVLVRVLVPSYLYSYRNRAREASTVLDQVLSLSTEHCRGIAIQRCTSLLSQVLSMCNGPVLAYVRTALSLQQLASLVPCQY